MIVSIRQNGTSRESLALFVCLFMAAGSVQGTVLCFGADGHIEFESAFHENSCDPDRSCQVDHRCDSPEAEHGESGHCHYGQCVDVPIAVDLAKVSLTIEQWGRAFAAVCADVATASGQPGQVEYCPAPHSCFCDPYFSPLRTIVLLA